MAYSADSFVADEQPTTAKWNKLWTNDASFNDGSGLAFTTNNVVPASALAAGAIYLGRSTPQTADYSVSSNNTMHDVTNGSVTVTVPAGGRNVLLMAYAKWWSNGTSGMGTHFYFREGSTTLSEHTYSWPGAGYAIAFNPIALIVAPSAGSHTYKMTVLADSTSTVTIKGDATVPFYIAAFYL